MNKKLHEEITKLENRKLELVKKKQEVEAQLMDTRSKLIKEINKLGLEIVEVNADLAQKRREWKVEATPARKMRNKLDDEYKKQLIAKVGKCQECSATEDLSVHHIKPLSHGGTHEEKNLKVLCLKCHRKYHPI